jgi:hypothetical protein
VTQGCGEDAPVAPLLLAGAGVELVGLIMSSGGTSTLDTALARTMEYFRKNGGVIRGDGKSALGDSLLISKDCEDLHDAVIRYKCEREKRSER